MSEVMNSRRSFLKGAALGTFGAMAAGSSIMEAEAKEGKKEGKKEKFDVVIVGAGCGGLVCAVRAAQNGLKPLLLEKMGYPAGNTIYAAGFLLGVHTKAQQAVNSNTSDTVDKFYEDMLKVSKGHGDKQLTRYIAEHCDETLNWMMDYCGIKFKAGLHVVWPQLERSHLVQGPTQPGGAQLATTLIEKAKSLGAEIRFNTKVLELLTDEDTGAVTGVVARDEKGAKKIYAKYGVVLSTGGYSANNAMVSAYCGQAASHMPIRGSRIISGENIRLTEKVSAKYVNVDQFHCGPIYGPTGANPLNIVNNGVCVSSDTSKRFTDEGQTYVQMSRDVAAMTKQNWAFIICDQNTHDLKLLANDWLSYKRTGAPVYQADTIEELAKKAGLDPKVLPQVIAEYNQAVKDNKRDQLQPVNTLVKPPVVEKAPFYAVPFQGGMTATFGGPLINVKGQVLDTEMNPVEGLYAIGNAAGGIFYDNYVGGAQLTNAAVFGYHVADEMKEMKAAQKKA